MRWRIKKREKKPRNSRRKARLVKPSLSVPDKKRKKTERQEMGREKSTSLPTFLYMKEIFMAQESRLEGEILMFDVYFWRERERKQRNTKLLPAFIFFRLYIRSPSGSPPSLLFTSHTFLSMYVFISCDSLIPAFEQREKEGNRPLVCVGEWVSLSASFSSLKVRGGRREDVIRKKKWESQVLLWVRVGTNCWQQKREEIKTVTWRTSRERMIERKVL